MKYAATALISILVACTIARNDVWRSERSLWADAAAKSPGSPRAALNLARDYHLSGNLQRAFDGYQLAMALAHAKMQASPQQAFLYRDMLASAQTNLGNLLISTGHTLAGERAFEATLGLSPAFGPAIISLAHLWNVQGRHMEALQLIELSTGKDGAGFTGKSRLYFEKAVALCGIGAQLESDSYFYRAARTDADIRRIACPGARQ